MPEVSENTSNPEIAVPPVETVAPAVPNEVKLSPAARTQFIEEALLENESSLIGHAANIVQDVGIARGVVQDTFVRLCQQDIHSVRDHIRSWLHVTCRDLAREVIRKDQRTRPLEDIRWKKVAGEGVREEEPPVNGTASPGIAGFMDRLTEKQREVILLKLQQGLTYQEIHKVTGLTTANISFLIHTGLKRLRETIPDDIRN